ncbi:ATP-dependent Clp protease proteolytic subunit [Gloeobacter morelensis]|uniref:ATP-dependent Clp protease proteolytic subunit n=1 Tax=Gloeobacter morelensis MG652769 TaxID=2781736 RepID=A0ABY3PQL9_9CYAN|nr:ATP-dependent Clp protease proteolytic subunit [Gloeobacter morelensis]UFP95987.1 ATP-dependent Clp protease proteolytic subunit [Gloeobacter morelensis MG652769]
MSELANYGPGEIRAAYSGDYGFRTPPPDLPSLLLNERIVYLGTPINDVVAELLIAQLLYLESEDNAKPIEIYINSPGVAGFETSAFAVYDTMRHVRMPIKTICLGLAGGFSALLMAAGTKGQRMSLPNSRIILYQPYGGARGQATDINIRAQELLTTKRTLNQLLSIHTGKTVEQIDKDTERLFYMSPQEAVSYGLIDKVLEPSANKLAKLKAVGAPV